MMGVAKGLLALAVAFCAAGYADAACNSNNCALGICTLGICLIGKSGGGTDPVIRGFDGVLFDLPAEADKYYLMYTDLSHQVVLYMFEARLWNKNGTYIGGVGFEYAPNHRVSVQLMQDGDLTVEANGAFHVVDGSLKVSQHKLGEDEDDHAVLIGMEAHAPGLGRVVRIQTDTVKLDMWAAAPGAVDEGGFVQPSYINFNFSMLQSPAGDDAQGFLGESFYMAPGLSVADLKLNKEAMVTEEPINATNVQPFNGRGSIGEYEVQGYFDHAWKWSLFGTRPVAKRARSLIASKFAGLTFPVSAELGHN